MYVDRRIEGVVGPNLGPGRLRQRDCVRIARMRIRYAVLVALAALFSCALAGAQEPVKPAANVESLFQDKNKKLNDMKQVAYHIEKDLLQCNHWNEATNWLTERYIQHNPVVGSGRAGVVKFFGSRPVTATCEKLDAPVVAVLADGDLVTVVTVANRKDSKGEAYTTTWFDMWRIVDGKADEHWDPMVKQ
jgi:predicted SnoaL-like aldol condensation-catalyzing enzyme